MVAAVSLVVGAVSDPPILSTGFAVAGLVFIAMLFFALMYAEYEHKRPTDATVRRQENALTIADAGVSFMAFYLGVIGTLTSDASDGKNVRLAVALLVLSGLVGRRAVVSRKVAGLRRKVDNNEVEQKLAAHAKELEARVEQKLAARIAEYEAQISELSALVASRCETGADRIVPPAPRRRRGLRWAVLAALRR